MGSYNFLTLKSSRSDLLKPESFWGSVVDTSNFMSAPDAPTGGFPQIVIICCWNGIPKKDEQPRAQGPGVNRWESGDIETRSMTWRMKKKSAPCSAIWSCDQMQVRFVCAWSPEVWTDVYPFKKIEKAFEKTLKGLKHIKTFKTVVHDFSIFFWGCQWLPAIYFF